MAEAARNQLDASLKDYLASGQYFDITITCGSDTYKAHKIIVCSRVGFFARAIAFPGKLQNPGLSREQTSLWRSKILTITQEAESSKIDLPQDEPQIIKLLMDYAYEGDYRHLPSSPSATGTKPTPNFTRTSARTGFVAPLSSASVAQATPNYSNTSPASKKRKILDPNFPHTCSVPPLSYALLTHAKMYDAADNYDAVGLKDLSREKFNRACQHFWDNTNFAVAAHHAFSTTPETDKGLRDIVSKTLFEYMEELVKKPEVEALLAEFNGLAFGLLKMKTEAGWK